MERLYKAESFPDGRNSIKSESGNIWFNPVNDEAEINWDEAPEWADKYGAIKIDHDIIPVFYSDTQYKYLNGAQLGSEFYFGGSCTMHHSRIDFIKDRPNQDKPDDKPLYTQEMADNDELPLVGMEVLYTCIEHQSGKPVIEVGKWYFGTVIAYHDGFVWTSDNGLRMLSNTVFKPIPTKPDLIDGAAYQFDFKGVRNNTHDSDNKLIGICHTSIKYGVEHVMFESPISNGKWNTEHCTNIKPLTPEGE